MKFSRPSISAVVDFLLAITALLHAFPFGPGDFESGMRNPQMPNHGLEGFGVRRDVCGIDCRDDNRHVGNLRGVPSVATYNAENRATSFLRKLKCAHQIRTDIFFKAAAAY